MTAVPILRAQQADVPPLNETVPSVPAVVRARSLMVIGAGRPDQALTLLAATANVEERSLATTGAALAGHGAQGALATVATLAAAHRLGVAPLPEVPVPFEPDPPKPIDKAATFKNALFALLLESRSRSITELVAFAALMLVFVPT